MQVSDWEKGKQLFVGYENQDYPEPTEIEIRTSAAGRE
jgi:hypothetical protein